MNGEARLRWMSMVFVLAVVAVGGARAAAPLAALQPADGAVDVNVGVLRWTEQPGCVYDLRFGTEAVPPPYRTGLTAALEKPVVLELNRTYRWQVVARRDTVVVATSPVFSFATLPIALAPSLAYGHFVDARDDKVYWTVTVGGREWMAQNLDHELPDASWYYDDDPRQKVYGRLYAGRALAGDQAAICPAGWRLPTRGEWVELLDALGGAKVAGPACKEAGPTHWRRSDAARLNTGGLTVLPGGSRDRKPSFSNLGKYANFWTATPDPETPGSYYQVDFGFMRDAVNLSAGDGDWSYAIRCVRD